MTTTTRLHLTWRDQARAWLIQRDPLALFALAILPIIGLLIALSAWRGATAPAVAAQPTPPLPIIIVATALAEMPPTAVPPVAQVAALPPNALRRAVVAYGAPDASTAIGAIESGRTYAVLARYGADWLQADVAGSGVVWLKADQLLDLPAGLADLEPPPAPVVVERPIYVAVQQPARAPVVDAVSTPAPAYQVTSAPLADTQLSERQRNIQGRLVDPNVAQQWAAQQWRDEHCIGEQCIP